MGRRSKKEPSLAGLLLGGIAIVVGLWILRSGVLGSDEYREASKQVFNKVHGDMQESIKQKQEERKAREAEKAKAGQR